MNSMKKSSFIKVVMRTWDVVNFGSITETGNSVKPGDI